LSLILFYRASWDRYLPQLHQLRLYQTLKQNLGHYRHDNVTQGYSHHQSKQWSHFVKNQITFIFWFCKSHFRCIMYNKKEIYQKIIYPKSAELMKDLIIMTGLYWPENLRHGNSHLRVTWFSRRNISFPRYRLHRTSPEVSSSSSSSSAAMTATEPSCRMLLVSQIAIVVAWSFDVICDIVSIYGSTCVRK